MRRPGASTLLLVVLGLLLFRASLFLGEVFYKRDVHLVWHAQVETMVRAVAEGAWPIWDPNPAFGQPFLANPDAQIAYPPTWVNVILRPWVYYTLYAVAHFFLAAFGMRSLAGHLGLSPPAALLSAGLWALSGPFLSMVDLWHHYAGAAWMPWVLLAADRALGGMRREVAIFALVFAAQILASSADMCALTLLVAVALAAARHLDLRRPLSSGNARVVARGTAGVLLAAGLGAPLWLTALDVVSVAARSRLPEGVRTYWSLHPAVGLETVVPGLWSHLPLHGSLRALFFESREPFLSSLYLGAGSLGLVVAGAVASRHGLRRVLLGILVLSVLMAFGAHTPVYAVATTLLPPLRILRYPVKFMVVAAFAWSLLAGLGAEAWREGEARRVARCLVGSATVLVLLTVALVLLARFPPVSLPGTVLALPDGVPLDMVLDRWSLRIAVTCLVSATSLGLAVALLRERFASDRLRVAAIALAVVDLAVYHRTPNPTGPLALYTHRPEVVEALAGSSSPRLYVYDYSFPGKAQEHLGVPAPQALARSPAGWDPGAAGALAMQMYLTPESAGRWGLSQAYSIDLRGLHLFSMARLETLVRRVEGTPAHLRMLQAGGTTHVVSLHRIPGLDLERSFPGLFEYPILLQRVPSPLPRAFVVSGAMRASDDEAIGRLVSPDFDLKSTVLLADGENTPPLPGFRGEVAVVEAKADRMVLEADLSAPGYVVLLDTYDRGWRARLDGQETRLHRANLVFRAVGAGAGRHRIELLYRPRGLMLGLALCASTAVLVVALAIGLPKSLPRSPAP